MTVIERVPVVASVIQEAPESSAIPPLVDGERLTRAEFERRWDAMPDLKRAELIDGVVQMPSPVSPQHGFPHFDLIGWMSPYRLATPGVRGGDNTSLRLDMESMPQPDVFLMVLPAYGGSARFDIDGHVTGGPELVAEVGVSTASYDLQGKLDTYQRNGVQEYIAWQVLEAGVDWFVLREGQYEELRPGADGILRSEALPGLWLDPLALVQEDLLRVMEVLQRGIASPEHEAFVARLRENHLRAEEREG